MTSGRSILILFVFLLFILPFLWFINIFPVTSAKYFFRNLSVWVNTSLVDQYPSDLLISVNQGRITLNRPTPYCLVISPKSQLGILFDLLSKPDLHAFESNGPYSQLCQPFVVVGQDYLMSLNQSQIKITQISSQLTFKLDKTTITDFVGKYLPIFIAYGQTAYLVIPFILIPLVFVFILLNNFWYSFFAKLVLKIFKIYQDNFSSKIYGTTLFCYLIISFFRWIVVGYVFNHLFKLNLMINFPFLDTIFITIASVIYFSRQKKPTASIAPPDSLPPSPPIQFQTITPPKFN